jgi:hypothetical protein
MKNEKPELLFSINGFDVYKNRMYRVDDKRDGDAPSGFVKAGVSKLPSDDIDESFHFRYTTDPGSQLGLWDTGFYKNSPCYRGLDEKEADVIAKQRVKTVLKPYQSAIGSPMALENQNQESLDKTSWKVGTGMIYNTNNPIDTMRLYATLLTGNAAPAGQEKSAKYSTASYIIVDVTKVSKDREDQSVSVMKTVSMFNKLLENDPTRLQVILKWLNLGKYPANADADTLSSIFYQTIKDDMPKCRLFMATIEEMASKQVEEKMYIYKQLVEDIQKRSSPVTVAPNGKIFFEDIELGGDLKTASETISKHPDLRHLRAEILTGEKIVDED